jgi:ribonuclease P protein component
MVPHCAVVTYTDGYIRYKILKIKNRTQNPIFMIPKKHRLSQQDFKKYLGKTRVLNGTHLYIRFSLTDLPNTHFSVVVSKKIAKTSVLRNKIKRRAYAVVSEYLDIFPKGFICMVFMGKGSSSLSYRDLSKELQELLGKIKI